WEIRIVRFPIDQVVALGVQPEFWHVGFAKQYCSCGTKTGHRSGVLGWNKGRTAFCACCTDHSYRFYCILHGEGYPMQRSFDVSSGKSSVSFVLVGTGGL